MFQWLKNLFSSKEDRALRAMLNRYKGLGIMIQSSGPAERIRIVMPGNNAVDINKPESEKDWPEFVANFKKVMEDESIQRRA